MQTGTNESRQTSNAIRIEGLRLSAEEMAAVRKGLTIALTQAHFERRGRIPSVERDAWIQRDARGPHVRARRRPQQ